MTRADIEVFSSPGVLTERMRKHDWSQTPVGPVEDWPIALRTLVSVMLGSKQPMFTVWGPARSLLYNDAYIAVLGHKDRDALGRCFLDVWDEARADLLPLVERAYSGDSVHMDDITLIVDREGLDPEAHFAFSYTPVRDGAGIVQGFLCVCRETTEYVKAGRRQAFRLDLELALRDLDDADAIIAAACAMLGEHLQAGRVVYGEMQPDGRSALLRTAWSDGAPPLQGVHPIGTFGRAQEAELRRGVGVAVADTEARPDVAREVVRDMGLRAYVAAPIVRAGRLAATLLVTEAAPRRWALEDVALVESVAARLSDAVQRAHAEQEARASEARFRTLTQALPSHVWTATPAGAIDWLNERAVAYLGGIGSDAGRARIGFAAFVHPDDLAAMQEGWAAALASGGVYEVEFRLRRSDGVYRWHLSRAVEERDAGGRIVRWVGTNVDIDDQKRAELDLSAAKLAAEEANLAKSTFIANMSHELRTPLSAIIGYSEMMAEEIADGCEASELSGDMVKVESNARHLLGLINDVLDLSKVESGKMEVFAEEFLVEPVLREIAATVDSLVGKKGNTLRLAVEGELGTARTDLVKLRQVLLNLLSNAAKFTEGGTITLGAAREGGTFRFTVADTGIGMTEEQLSRLFQRFTQADASTTRRFGGTGLGLSLARAFADMLGGTVSVRSAPGEGSTFTLTIPASYAAGIEEEQDAPPPPDEAPAPAAGDLVLVIDDDADQRALMARFLRREKFQVQLAADGRTGLALARQLHPRAILLDVLMPGVDGWSVLTELKSDPSLGEIPVVMVTSVDQRSLASSLGAADYMLKPLHWDRFREVVNRFRATQGGVLLVEDELAERVTMRAMLERDGWTVMEAGNGREGLDLAEARHPDVVVLDLNMPIMDGFDFLDAFRTLPGCAHTPVVVLTARDLTREDRNRLRGASQILNKGSVSRRSLAERIHTLAEGGEPVRGEA